MLKNKDPDFSALNQLVAQVMCGVSTSLRFPGQLNGFVSFSKRFLNQVPILTDGLFSDFRKMGMNLVPFPRVRLIVN
jgi:tubulin beta